MRQQCKKVTKDKAQAKDQKDNQAKEPEHI